MRMIRIPEHMCDDFKAHIINNTDLFFMSYRFRGAIAAPPQPYYWVFQDVLDVELNNPYTVEHTHDSYGEPVYEFSEEDVLAIYLLPKEAVTEWLLTAGTRTWQNLE